MPIGEGLVLLAPVVPPPVTTSIIDTGKRLGCGEYRVFLQAVGGSPVLAEFHFSSATYGRRLDDMSDATVTLFTPQDAECYAHLADLAPFSYEIAIWRDDEEVWVGPTIDPNYAYDSVTVSARDVFMWLERRILPTDRTFSVPTDLAEIARIYANDALAQDLTPNISIVVAPTGITGIRSVSAVLFRRAADEIRELSRTGLDFTAIGRTLRFGGREIDVPSIGVLTEDIFEITEARLDGLAMANHVFILGSSGGGVNSPTVGEAGGGTVTPLIQQVYSEPGILDAESAEAAALTRWDLLKTPPFYIRGRLLETAPYSFNDLIPGARGEVRQQVGFRRIETEVRLVSVDVDVSAEDNGTSETITIALEPIGSVEEI